MNRKQRMFNSTKALKTEMRRERAEEAMEAKFDKERGRAFTPTTSSSTLMWAGVLMLLIGLALMLAAQSPGPIIFALPLAILSWIGSAIAKPLDRILYHMIEERDTRD